MELEACGLSVANATEPVLVLGAAGGAGSMAVALLASQGYKAGKLNCKVQPAARCCYKVQKNPKVSRSVWSQVVASSRRAESLRPLA